MRTKQQLCVCTCESSKGEIYLTIFDVVINTRNGHSPCAVPYGQEAPAICKDANLTEPVSVFKDNNFYAFFEYTITDYISYPVPQNYSRYQNKAFS